MNTAATTPDGSGWYEVRLQGRLDSRWAARFDGMTLTTGEGYTLLAGPVVDQAALHGLLHQLRDLGSPPDLGHPGPVGCRVASTSHLRHAHPQEPDMTITATTATVPGVRPDPTRNHARAAGIFYLLTFLSSIPALILIGPILNDAGYVTGAGQDTRVIWGCLLDTVNALTAVGSAVAVYSVVKRKNGSMALGFVTSRLIEAAVIMIGVVSLLAVVTMRQDLAGSGADAASVTVTANALVDVRNWTFLFGPGLMPALNAVLFATLLRTSRLVPRIIPTVGLVGAPLLFAAFLANLFGVFDQVSGASLLLTLPIAAWELSVGIWMTFKGFRPEAVAALAARDDA